MGLVIRREALGSRSSAFGPRLEGSSLKVEGLGFRFLRFRDRVGFGFQGFEVQGSGFKGLGFRGLGGTASRRRPQNQPID